MAFPDGVLELTWLEDDVTGERFVRIDRADPHAFMDAGLMEHIDAGAYLPYMSRDGDVIELADDFGKRFTYQLGALVETEHGALLYEMEWVEK